LFSLPLENLFSSSKLEMADIEESGSDVTEPDYYDEINMMD
jgi:hypothetical protein